MHEDESKKLGAILITYWITSFNTYDYVIKLIDEILK
jgi:hypothetical protein